MIWESWPLKRDLMRRANSLRRRKGQRRWSDTSCATVEQDIFISAYGIRKLIDAGKISDEVESSSLRASTHQPSGRAVDIMNWNKIDKLYDLSSNGETNTSLREFCNQVIHSFVFLLCFDEKNGGLSGLFVASDREKERRLLYFNIDLVIEAIARVAEDDIVTAHLAREAIGKQIRVIRKSNRLPKLMLDKLRVKDAEKTMEIV